MRSVGIGIFVGAGAGTRRRTLLGRRALLGGLAAQRWWKLASITEQCVQSERLQQRGWRALGAQRGSGRLRGVVLQVGVLELAGWLRPCAAA